MFYEWFGFEVHHVLINCFDISDSLFLSSFFSFSLSHEACKCEGHISGVIQLLDSKISVWKGLSITSFINDNIPQKES